MLTTAGGRGRSVRIFKTLCRPHMLQLLCFSTLRWHITTCKMIMSNICLDLLAWPIDIMARHICCFQLRCVAACRETVCELPCLCSNKWHVIEGVHIWSFLILEWQPIESANIAQSLLDNGCLSLRELIDAIELESSYLAVSIAIVSFLFLLFLILVGFVSIVNLSQSSHLSSLVGSFIHKDIDRKVVA